MIKGNLYKLKSIGYDGSKYSAVIALRPESEIYKGHFPCHPITPGVCLVQIAIDTISEIEKKPQTLTDAKDIKFLSVVSPEEHKSLRYDLTKTDNDGKWGVCVYAGDLMCSKMSIKVCKTV